MKGKSDDQQGKEDRHQPSRWIEDKPDLPIVFRVLRRCNLDVTHNLDLVEVRLEPGIGSDYEEMNQCSDPDVCGVGHLELLMKLFRLLIGKARQRLRHDLIPLVDFR